MKEVYRNADHSQVSYFAQVLKQAGIEVMIRNEDLHTSGITGFPVPTFYPNISVMNDADYEKAWTIINDILKEQETASDEEIACPHCGAKNPANFDFCYQCEKSLRQE